MLGTPAPDIQLAAWAPFLQLATSRSFTPGTSTSEHGGGHRTAWKYHIKTSCTQHTSSTRGTPNGRSVSAATPLEPFVTDIVLGHKMIVITVIAIIFSSSHVDRLWICHRSIIIIMDLMHPDHLHERIIMTIIPILVIS